jgi:hypothetical protein
LQQDGSRRLFVIPHRICLSFRSEAEESAACHIATISKQLQIFLPITPAKSFVKPQNHPTPCQQMTCAWHIHPGSARIIKRREKESPDARIEGFSF